MRSRAKKTAEKEEMNGWRTRTRTSTPWCTHDMYEEISGLEPNISRHERDANDTGCNHGTASLSRQIETYLCVVLCCCEVTIPFLHV